MSEWIQVKDRVPEVGARVLYYFEVTGVSLGRYIGKDECGHVFGGRDGFLGGDVTHWMPAPEPPISSRRRTMDKNVKWLAEGLALAVMKDEAPEVGGFDLSAGMFGPNVSDWLRDVATKISTADQPAEAPRHTCNTQESLNGPCLACIADEQRAAFPTS